MKTVTVSEMKEIERLADASGLSYYQMMENAGTESFKAILSNYPSTKSLLIFCGKGNNGGDGLVVARLAANSGISVCVILVEGVPVTEDALTNFNKLPQSVNIIDLNDIDDINNDTVIVDALYGTGFHGELRESGRHACNMMDSLGLPIVSLDIPSGCNADSKAVADGAITSDITIVFHAYKNIHVSSVSNCGKIVLADIGINT